jgi:hypothetical protein
MTRRREELIGLAREAFSFLGKIEGCVLLVLEPNTLLTTVAYVFPDVAVEFQFDWRDLDVACLISRPATGRLPPGYLLHNGRRVRFRLGDLTPAVITRFRELPPPPRRRGSLDEWAAWQTDRMADGIGIYADILRTDFANIRADADARFRAARGSGH